jgi:hypothetical protein
MLNLSDSVNGIINKFSSIKFLSNPINISVIITIIVLLIFIYASEQDNPKIKMLFWSFIIITPMMFAHDKILSNTIKEENKSALGAFAALDNNTTGAGEVSGGAKMDDGAINMFGRRTNAVSFGAMTSVNRAKKPEVPEFSTVGRDEIKM